MKILLSIFTILVGLYSFSQPIITLDSTTAPLCHNSTDGAIYISVSGGTAPYTFDWSIDGLGDNDDAEDLIGISGGIDTCIIIDSNLDTDTLIVDLIAPSEIQFTFVSNTPTCCGANDGSFEILASGGTPGYFYTIDDFITTQTSGSFINLFSGLYHMFVLDANGCMDSVYSAISSSFPLDIGLTAIESCNGANTGEITTSIWGGCGVILFDWDIDGTGDYDDDPNLTDLAPGTYTLQVTNVSGCYYDSQTITIGVNNNYLQATIDSVNHNLCINGSQGAIFPLVSSGTAPFLYDWDIDGFGDYNDSLSLDSLPAGNYTLAIMDDLGCIDTLHQTILDGPVFNATINQNEAILSANEPGNYQWITCPSYNPISGVIASTFTAIQNGMYAVIIENADGCIDTSACVTVDGLGISDDSNGLFTIYPNPSQNGHVILKLNSTSVHNVSVSDTNGKILIQKTLSAPISSLDLSQFSKGIYLVEISSDSQHYIEKLVLN